MRRQSRHAKTKKKVGLFGCADCVCVVCYSTGSRESPKTLPSMEKHCNYSALGPQKNKQNSRTNKRRKKKVRDKKEINKIPDEGGFSHISICFEPYQASRISRYYLHNTPHRETMYNATENLPVSKNLYTFFFSNHNN